MYVTETLLYVLLHNLSQISSTLTLISLLAQTNTVVESPAQVTVNPAPFALVAPLPERDPIRAAGEWRDREAERREKKHGKIQWPGVTWDLGEDPPEPLRALPPRNFFAENLDVMAQTTIERRCRRKLAGLPQQRSLFVISSNLLSPSRRKTARQLPA